MDPITAALFVGASFASSVISNKQQARAENAAISLQQSQAKVQAAEAALDRTEAFRLSASSNLALSGMGVGGTGSLALAQNLGFANYSSDINAINRNAQFVSLGGEANKALSKSKRFANNVAAVESAASLASKLGIFSPSKAPVKKAK
tara:strand:- start:343 stop:786 length:444 start_codon:yes stop_codon:yes gene_type:complete